MNERDIFQFEDLGYRSQDYVMGVEWIISDTFMENMILENGKTMGEYILEVGEELSVSPVHIAARIRQERVVVSPLHGKEFITKGPRPIFFENSSAAWR